jgi:hypothetical protein
MRRFFASLYRITSRAGFLAFALVLALLLWYLPSLLNLDTFRPRVTGVLETTFHCKVIVGGITGQIIPSPGLVIAPVVLLDNADTPRVLASVNAVRMSLSARTLLKGDLEIKDLRFIRPRFIAHRIRKPSGQSRWVMLTLPKAPSSQEKIGIEEWQVRNGRIEIWDQTRTPTAKWVADQLSGSFRVRQQTGALEGRALQLGRSAILAVHYSGAAPFPIQARLDAVELSALPFLPPARLLTLEGQADLSIQTRFQPATEIRAQLDQPSGAGDVEASIQNNARGNWRWSASGKHGRLKGTAFEVPEWSAKEDDKGLAVHVRGTTVEGGMTEVSWTKPPASAEAALEVDLSSVTIRQVLEIFKAEAKTPAAEGAAFNPSGYESWRISQGSMKALIHGATSFEVQESGINVAGMHLDLAGTFDLSKANPEAHIQGKCLNIPMTTVIESFFPAPSLITGSGTADFSLSFPLSDGWIKGLSGPVQVEVKDGVLKTFKTMYRIMAVLNLGNYLRLRLPKITAKGIEIEDLSGHLTFGNGVLYTKDLFLKSPNMNLGVKGSLDIPGRQMKATLRLEMLRFLEDILRDVPLTHWIFKKPNKIFLPLVVSLEGPWNNIDVH